MHSTRGQVPYPAQLVICSALAAGCAGAPGSDSPVHGGDVDNLDAAEPPGLPQTLRFPRLSHRQWENTVRDLLRLDGPTGKSAMFIDDPLGGDYDNNSDKLVVSPTLWLDYRRAAEELAAWVIADPARVAAVIPAVEGDSDARARAFIEDFGRRAYRRPLWPSEVNDHLAVFHQGAAVGGDDPFLKGVRATLQAFLQSPHFLYRVELSDTVEHGRIKLDRWEIAAKLSYMLWDTMPDDALFAAAEAGALDSAEGVEAEAARMLADPRARAMLASFHEQTLQLERYRKITKDPDLFPEFTDSLREAMVAETLRFVDDVVFEHPRGDVATLFSAPYSFVNAALAPLYGVAGEFGDALVKVDLDPGQRAGVLTHLGVLAANASAIENDPIHRGVFLNLRILCTDLPPPPATVPPVPPPQPGESLRERIDRHTGKGTCGEACHANLINPLGFALEQFDPLGRWQTADAGKPVDASGEYAFARGTVGFAGAVDLARSIADSEEAHRCYVGHLLEYGYGRALQGADDRELDRLAEGSLAGLYSIQELVLQLATSDAFRFRIPEEPQP